MLLKSLLDHFPARLYVQVVDFRVYVLNIIQLLAAFLVKDQLHFFLVLDVAGVDYRRLESHGSDHLGVVQGRVALAVINASGDEYQVRVDLFDLGNVGPSEFARSNKMYNAAGSQSRLFGRLGGHVVDQTVDSHLQPACGGGSCQHVVILQTVNFLFVAKIVYGSLEADSYVAVHDRGRRLTLTPEDRFVRVQIRECVDYCRGRAYFCY